MARPAMAAPEARPAPRIEQGAEIEPRRTRRSTLNQSGMPTDIPDNLKRPGWAYSWFPFMVINQPVEPWVQSAVEDGGWEPVRTDDMRAFVPSNYDRPVIEYGGQRLYTRPQYLEDESREEDLVRARRQSEGRLDAARTPDPRAPHTVGMQTRDETFVRRGQNGGDTAQMEAQAQYDRANRRAERAQQDPLGGSLRTSADDVTADEQAEIAAQHRAGRGRFGG